MDTVSVVLFVTQFLFMFVVIIYFVQNMRKEKEPKQVRAIDSGDEMKKLAKLRSIHLTEPLSEKTRPENFAEIVGQEKGIRALKAALCGPNPQHVLIYGPPGVGKTAAARIVLSEAINSEISPFKKEAMFVEMDATTLQFDERSIADPLIGSVHDPIYQGAGAYGTAGIPQPKPGAVTKAHGGILFLDEIGELHTLQMNKLLKVLEDRKVFLNSAYYSPENESIPTYIHDIFKNGLPADFRLIGATTRQPEDIPPAIRSRCTEIFFRSLNEKELASIADNAAHKAGFTMEKKTSALIAQFAKNGRETINIVQTAGSIAIMENRHLISLEDVEWVLEFGRYSPKPSKVNVTKASIGIVHGLAVYGHSFGAVMEIEAVSELSPDGAAGTLTVTGIAEEEEIRSRSGHIKRNSTARASVNNMLTIIQKFTHINPKNYNIHINFPGGAPVDGPSAGTAIFCAVYSSMMQKPIPPDIAMTGEISIKGKVLPVGGVYSKVEAAIESGIRIIYIPKDNWQKIFASFPAQVIPVESVDQLIQQVFQINLKKRKQLKKGNEQILTAEGL